MKAEEGVCPPRPLDKIPLRQLLTEQNILQKFLKNLESSNLPTLHDPEALRVTCIQNALMEQNLAAFREGRYQEYLQRKVTGLRKEIEQKKQMLSQREYQR